MNSCPPNANGVCALPWLSWYDPYWWRHYDQSQQGCQHGSCPTLGSYPHMAPVDETRCCANPLLGQTVLARRVEDGHYYLAQVRQEISRDRFLVLFNHVTRGKSRSANLQEIWVFDIISYSEAFRHPIVPGDKVLVHVGDSRYAPASVLQGSERRYGEGFIGNSDLLIQHIDGQTERIGQGIAVWIPPSLFERLAFELKLPYGARRSLLESMPPSETAITCNANGDCVAECSSGWPTCGDECEHIQLNNPYQCSNYYRTLYRSWPWWWRYWWQQLPPAWMMPQKNPVHRPLLRSRSCAAIPTEGIVCDDNAGICYATPVIEYDPLSRRVADQISEHSRLLMNQRSVSPCRIDQRRVSPCRIDQRRVSPSRIDQRSVSPCQMRPSYSEEMAAYNQALFRNIVKQWKPPTRWMPTNKNQYGTNKVTNVNYSMQDRAFAEWNDRSRPAPPPHPQPPRQSRPRTTYAPASSQNRGCHCGYC